MKVAVYGLGVVGGALAKYLADEGHEVLGKDPGLNINDDTAQAQIAFVCVPVPTKGFQQDLTILEEVLAEIKAKKIPITFLRSTLLPGTADEMAKKYDMRIVSCPEFLTERQAEKDTQALPIIVGLDGHQTLTQLLPMHTIIPMKNSECELAKYAHNCFGALKVTFFNGIYEMCKAKHLNYDKVLWGVLASGHINRPHTMVPGPDGQQGYGGKCFPKDMEAFIGSLKSNILGKLLLDAHCMNRFYRRLKTQEARPDAELDLSSPTL